MKHTNRLRVVRAERRVTQMDIAAKAGINLTRYWKIENGYLEPTDVERRRLSRALKSDESEVFPSAVAS